MKTTIQYSLIALIAIATIGCSDDDDQLNPVAAFALSDDLVAVNEPVPVLDESIEAQSLAWFINDVLQTDLNGNQSPTFFFDAPGEYQIKQIVTSVDNIKDSMVQVINVEYLTITSISLTKYFEDFKNWDPDSTGVKQNPDVVFRRQIGADVLFEGVTHWNVAQENLPIEVTIPNDWTFGFNGIPITEFLFYDNDFSQMEPMFRSSFGQEWEYDNVSNSGQTTVTTGGVEYVVTFEIL